MLKDALDTISPIISPIVSGVTTKILNSRQSQELKQKEELLIEKKIEVRSLQGDLQMSELKIEISTQKVEVLTEQNESLKKQQEATTTENEELKQQYKNIVAENELLKQQQLQASRLLPLDNVLLKQQQYYMGPDDDYYHMSININKKLAAIILIVGIFGLVALLLTLYRKN